MPNMVSLIAGGPNPENGKRLIDFLLSPETEEMLAKSEAVQIPLHPSVSLPRNWLSLSSLKPRQVDTRKVATRLEEVIKILAAHTRPVICDPVTWLFAQLAFYSWGLRFCPWDSCLSNP